MNIYLVTCNRVLDQYDTYDSFVCVASDPMEAVRLHPYGRPISEVNELDCTWVKYPHEAKHTYIGKASPNYTKAEVICASFNAK